MIKHPNGRRVGAFAIAAFLTSFGALAPARTPVIGSLSSAPASANEMMGGGMMGAGLAAGLVGGLIIGGMSHSWIANQDGDREDCIRLCGAHVHFSNIPGQPAIKVIKPPKLRRVNCNPRTHICSPVKMGPYQLWPYTDGAGNNYAQITDQNGNPVNTGAPGAQLTGNNGVTYTIIH